MFRQDLYATFCMHYKLIHRVIILHGLRRLRMLDCVHDTSYTAALITHSRLVITIYEIPLSKKATLLASLAGTVRELY